jgi:hypothetical protein
MLFCRKAIYVLGDMEKRNWVGESRMIFEQKVVLFGKKRVNEK